MKLYQMTWDKKNRRFLVVGVAHNYLPNEGIPASLLPADLLVATGADRCSWRSSGRRAGESGESQVHSFACTFARGGLVKAILSSWERTVIAAWDEETAQAEQIINE